MGAKAISVAAICGLLFACTVPESIPTEPAITRAAPPPRETRHLGQSRQGRPIRAVFLGDGPRVVLLIAAIHGDEAAGTPLLEELDRHLLEHPQEVEGRTVILVPVVNPDGRHHGTRGNSAGVDLNRNWPGANFRPGRRTGPKPLSEPESHALARLIEKFRPAVVVSIHQPLRCVDWDGPARDLAKAMGQACGLLPKQLGARPGSMGSHLGVDRGIPIITLELPAGPGDWSTYGPALMEAIRRE